MSQSYNYIKVKSRKQLQRENDSANLAINKAGTHATLPGGTHMPIGRLTPEGVPMPAEHSPPTSGDSLSGTERHSWTPSSGLGAGNVDAPALQATDPINPAPHRARDSEFFTQRRIGRTSRPGPGFDFDAASDMPQLANAFGGSLDATHTQGSVGRDINSVDRIRLARLKSRR